MTKVVRIWKKMSFWNKMERFFAMLSAIAVEELARHEAPYEYFIVLGIFGIVAKSIHIWFEDVNGDGIIDILQNNNE